MARLTRAKLHSRVEAIRKEFGAEIALNFYRPGSRSLGQITSSCEGRLISPRLPINELDQWLDGFVQSYVEFERKRTDFFTLLTAANTLAELAEGLQANQKAGPIHNDFLVAARIVRETHGRFRDQIPSRKTNEEC